ncbi:MAG: aromatic ring hydroxylase [Dehalococcoidia bacterium]|nr:MAG: aromatic ring hydroxylase [Dehalococcoidia bacterium]
MITSQEFVERMKSLKPNCYMHGELIQRDDPRMMVAMKDILMTYDMVDDPRFKDILVTTSHLTGNKINRFTNVHQSVEDLLAKQKMTRELSRLSGTCIQRCMGIDMVNALSIVTKEADDKNGGKTEYHERFKAFLKEFQDKDMVGAAAQTDVKGDRMLRPHEQADPDLYMRVVERNAKGIVVRGCKVHTTVGPYCDEMIVTPCRSLTKEEGDYSVCFSVPADTKGIHMLIEAANPTARKALPAEVANHGIAHSVTIFDDVFVPWERVFLDNDPQLGARAALLFALYHRHSYTGCKPAYTDVLMGTTALIAEVSGIEKQQHVRHKIAEMISVAELVYASGIAAAHTSTKASSGTQVPDVVFCNVGRKHAGTNIYHEYDILCDICGGQPQTMPYEEEYADPRWRPYLDKYFMRKADVPPETIHRAFRLAQDLIAGPVTSNMQIAGVHGGGSPIMEDIAIWGSYPIEEKKKIARHLAGIPETPKEPKDKK